MHKALQGTGISVRKLVTGKGITMILALFFAFLVALIASISIYARDAHAVTNSTINFQARILQANGAVVPDGNYSVQFKIYDAAVGGTNEWTETQSSLASKNGYITASLGSVTAFASTIDWSQEHWLTMNVNGDGEMGPNRMKITAVPYAFRSGQSDSLTNGAGTISASQLAQLAPGSVQGVNSTNAALRINQTGAGNLLQLQTGGADTFTVANNGDTAIGGALAVTNGITVGNSTSTTAGTIRWTGTAFEGYDGSNWTALSGLTLSSGASASFVSGLANVAANTTGTAVETLVFTSATGVSNTAGVTGFTAPAAGSFRTCLIKNNAAITGGTLNLRWRVNGVSVGAGACTMNSTTNRQSAGSLDAGVVTFNAGDTIGIAFDTVGLAPAASNDFTVYWSVEYNSSSTGLTLQKVYDASPSPATIVTANNKDIKYTLSDTATDSNFLVDIATGSTSKFAVQNNGTDILNINTSGGTTISGTLTVSGQTRFNGNVVAGGAASGVTATAAAPTKTNVTTVTLTAGAFANNDVIFINNAGQDYYTRIVSGGGTTNLVVSPAVSYDAGATIERYTVQNIGATSTDYTTQSNRFFQGYFLGGVVVGAGSTTISDGSIESTTTLRLQSSGGALEVGGALTATGIITGNGSGLTNINGSQITSGSILDTSLSANVTLAGNTFNGNNQLVQLNGSGALPALNGSALTSLTAGNLTGALPALNGAALTTLSATNISSGTVADARLSSNVTLAGNTFNAANGLVQLNGTSQLPAVSGVNLTGLNATNVGSGTLADARLSANVTLLGNTFNGVSQLVRLDGSGNLPALNGAALTTLSATNISSGTVADARLSANVALLGTAQTFTARPTFSGGVVLGTTAVNTSGAIRWTGTDFEGYNGSAWQSLTLNPTLYKQGGNSFGALAILGTSDNNALAFNTNGTEAARFTAGGSLVVGGGATAPRTGELVDINGTLRSNKYLLGTGPDLSLLPVAGGQSVLTSWWGLQLVGNKQSTVDYTPANIGAAGDFSVIIPNQQATKIGLVVRGQTAQSVDLSQFQSSTGLVLSSFNANGQLVLGNDGTTPQAGLLTFNDATASNGFTSVLGTNTLTASRAINLPDASGTLCISGSTTCGFIVLGSATAQTDAGTNSSIFINKTGASGNLLTLQKNGSNVLSVLNNGALQLRLGDASAFNVSNAAGTQQYFNVDTSTTSGLVQIGGATADANATLLVLDTKNTAGDPTGVNGSIYYNSVNGKSRCYENSIWQDCITAINRNKSAVQTVTNSATFTNDSALVYSMATNSSYNIDASINFSTTSAAADFKYTFTVPTGSAIYLNTDATASATSNTICNITASGQTCTLLIAAGFRGIIQVKGTVVTSTTAGNLQFQFAQNTQTAGQSVSVYQGSVLQITRTNN